MNDNDKFEMLNKDIIYFDNAATTFKPKCVIDEVVNYYTNYCANSHRGEYDISYRVDDNIDKTRVSVQEFINASDKSEVIFTYGCTDSINMIVDGFFKNILIKGDEVILSESEHASNILPWLVLAKKKGIVIKYAPLDKNRKLSIEDVINTITNKTKVISLAYITNVIGDVRDIKTIGEYAKQNNIYFVVDAAQAIGHIKTDVQDANIDFLAFSAHKMYGPTGLGVLYAKKKYLNIMSPTRFGGGMNENFNKDSLILEDVPYRFEGGTHNLAAIVSFYYSIDFINKKGINNIRRTEEYLRRYAIKRLEEIPYINILNKNSEGAIILINMDNVYCGDLGLYLNSKKICVRSGQHCAKMIPSIDGKTNSLRISFSFYNTYEEIDVLVNCLKDYEGILDFVK